MDNKIVGASQRDLQGQYIPDIVPLDVTNSALNLSDKCSIVDTFVLRDIQFSGMMRAKQGDRIMEVASDIQMATGKKIGTLRFGISLRPLDRVVAYAVNQALMMGAVGLGVGWLCAHILSKRLSQPILELQMSATKIAAGDLQHRAQIHSVDEIGILAASFNEMTAALQGSFSKLQRTSESFERFVPNKFISAIAPDKIENIHVGVALKRNMTILFCDIRGYTSMSEVMTPLETFAFLNDYLACMGKAIDEAGGFIDKYIGDAIMALFDDEATDGAVKAAILMQQALSKFNYERTASQRQGRTQNSLPKIAVGIGIHRGEVVMGTVGYACRIDSTVVGDAVNMASRVEGLTKQYKCGILVTESVVSSLQYPKSFALRLVDNAVKVKGKDEAIAIYELQI